MSGDAKLVYNLQNVTAAGYRPLLGTRAILVLTGWELYFSKHTTACQATQQKQKAMVVNPMTFRKIIRKKIDVDLLLFSFQFPAAANQALTSSKLNRKKINTAFCFLKN
jgi:hypothetical protein